MPTWRARAQPDFNAPRRRWIAPRSVAGGAARCSTACAAPLQRRASGRRARHAASRGVPARFRCRSRSGAAKTVGMYFDRYAQEQALRFQLGTVEGRDVIGVFRGQATWPELLHPPRFRRRSGRADSRLPICPRPDQRGRCSSRYSSLNKRAEKEHEQRRARYQEARDLRKVECGVSINIRAKPAAIWLLAHQRLRLPRAGTRRWCRASEDRSRSAAKIRLRVPVAPKLLPLLKA